MADIKYSLKNLMGFAGAKLYLNKELADVNFILKVDGYIQKVPANKSILAVLSPVFKAMFFGEMKEQGDVTIVDATIDAFKEFLQFFYLPYVKLSMGNMEEVVRLVDKYDVRKHVIDSVGSFNCELTLENVCWAYQLALLLEMRDFDLFNDCVSLIVGFTKDIFDSDTFCHCDRVVLKEILQFDSMACTEFDVLDACLTWAKFVCQRYEIDEKQPENWRKQLGDCFDLIRFGAMDIKEFVAHTVSYREELFTEGELARIPFAQASQSNQFHTQPRSKPLAQFYSKHMDEYDDENLTCSFPNTNVLYSCSLGYVPRMYFSTSCPIFLTNILLRDLHLERREKGNLDLVLVLKIFELSEQSFEVNVEKTIVFKKEVKIHVDARTPECTEVPEVNVLMHPRKMYEITWKGVQNHNSVYYYNSGRYYPDREVKINERLTVSFPLPEKYDGSDAYCHVDSGVVMRLTFENVHFPSSY